MKCIYKYIKREETLSLSISPSLLLFLPLSSLPPDSVSPLSSLPFLSLPLALSLAMEIPSRGEAAGKASLSFFISLSFSFSLRTLFPWKIILSLSLSPFLSRRRISVARRTSLPLSPFSLSSSFLSLLSSSLPRSLPFDLQHARVRNRRGRFLLPLLSFLLSSFPPSQSLSSAFYSSRDGNNFRQERSYLSLSLPLALSLTTEIPSRGEAGGKASLSRFLFLSSLSFSEIIFFSLPLSPRFPSLLSFSLYPYLSSRGELGGEVRASLLPFARARGVLPSPSPSFLLSLLSLSRDGNNFRGERSSLSRPPFHRACFSPSREKRRDEREETREER